MSKYAWIVAIAAVFVCATTSLLFAPPDEDNPPREQEYAERHNPPRDDDDSEHPARRDRERRSCRDRRPESDIHRILEEINDIVPEVGRLIREIQNSEPEDFRATIRWGNDLVNDLRELKQRNHREFEFRLKDAQLEAKCRLLSRRYHLESKKDEREDIRDDLKDSLAKLFDLRLKQMKRERDELKKELERVEKLVSEREKHRDDLIAKRLDRLTGKSDLEDW